jgi:hypothetical protein
MKNFKTTKEFFINICKENDACQPEFKKLLASKNMVQMFEVLKNNFTWCYNKKVLTVAILDDWFDIDFLQKQGVFHKGTIDEIKNREGIILLGDCIVKMCDSSTVQEMCDSSTVQKMCDSSTVQEMCDSSTVQKMCDSSTVQKMFDSSTVQKMCDSSTVQEMWGSSTVQKMWGSSTVRNFSSYKKEIKFEGNRFCFINYNTKEIFCGTDFKINQ